MTIAYEDGQPVAVDTIVISTQHNPEIAHADIYAAMMEHVIRPVIPAEMLTAVAAECGPCEKADEALTVEDVLEECEVTVPAWAREQAGIPENAKLACFVNEGDVIVGEAEACAPDLADVPRYVLKFFVDNHLNLRALDDMLNVWITPVPCSCEVVGDAE